MGFALVELLVVGVLMGLLALILVFSASSGLNRGKERMAEVLASEIAATLASWAMDVQPSPQEAIGAWGTDCLYRGTRSNTSPLTGAVYQVYVPPWLEECTVSYLGSPVKGVRVTVKYRGQTYVAER